MNHPLSLSLTTISLLAASCSTTHLRQADFGTVPEIPDADTLPLASVGGSGGDFASFDDLMDEPIVESVEVYDPLEPINRAVFGFNDKAYRYVLDPISKAYVAVVPTPLRTGIVNVFDNARYPERVVNQVLQGKPDQAIRETGRFVVDTTFGLGGFARPSDNLPHLQSTTEDTGQTLGHWGVGEGPYLVLPLLGPSNLRDGIGLAADTVIDPISQLDSTPRLVTRGGEIVAESPDYVRAYDSIKGGIAPYTSARDAYTQSRRAAVAE